MSEPSQPAAADHCHHGGQRVGGDQRSGGQEQVDGGERPAGYGAVHGFEAVDGGERPEGCGAADGFEVVDALPVLAEVRRLEPTRPPAAVALAQTAAVAATGFFAGVATAAVLGRRRQRRSSALSRPTGTLEIVSTRTYLVDVHLIERRG